MQFIKLNEQKSFLEVILNRPELHNAFNDEMIAEVTETFQNINTKKFQLVVLRAEGKSFCAGADLNWMKSMIDYTQAQNLQDSQKLAAMFRAINDCPLPVLAICHGSALGGGVGVISACDYVLASDSALFGLTEVRLGLLPAVISPFVIAKIGESHARAYFMSGERFSAKEAYQIGLVHKVVTDIETEAKNVIESFLKAAPQAAMIAKQLARTVVSNLNNSSFDLTKYTCELIAQKRVSQEGQEGMKALLEKRQPNWMRS
jgi:methylglutaconyl-CoA hydratase